MARTFAHTKATKRDLIKSSIRPWPMPSIRKHQITGSEWVIFGLDADFRWIDTRVFLF